VDIPRIWQMMSLFNRLINKTLAKVGYKIERLPERDDEDNAPRPPDEIIRMANRYYRPDVLRLPRRDFEDMRLKYIFNFIDVRDKRVLEIGPFLGYFSVLLEKMGVRENIAIESRADNLHKCQCVKKQFRLNQTQFIKHDLERLYRGEEIPKFTGSFDLVFCLGVLYHLPNPGRGLEWMLSQSATLFLGTQYVRRSSKKSIAYSYRGKSYRAQERTEGGIDDPISGMSPTSVWLYEDDLLHLIKDVGYSRIWVLGKDFQNHSDHIALLAER
jgi:2-polyprenyl-3-methyl-5-hydroxy-6-metoxy-1,4-benzoquinol methylase